MTGFGSMEALLTPSAPPHPSAATGRGCRTATPRRGEPCGPGVGFASLHTGLWPRVATIRLDLTNLAVGAILGFLVSLCSAWAIASWTKPRVKRYGFLTRPDFTDGRPTPVSGSLHKLWFELGGRRAPGVCSLEISYMPPGITSGADPRNVSVFAKWDERPSPLRGEADKQTFWPETVPDTFMQPLHLDRIYTVPFIFESSANGERQLFTGWWFAKRTDPRAVPIVEPDGHIRWSLSGQGLSWTETAPVSRVCGGGAFEDASSDSRQAQLRRFLDERHD